MLLYWKNMQFLVKLLKRIATFRRGVKLKSKVSIQVKEYPGHRLFPYCPITQQ